MDLTIVMGPILMFMMFSMGLSLGLQDFVRCIKQPQASAIGLICQILLLPAIAIIIARVLALSEVLTIGLVLISLCPGGITSNLFTRLAKGDLALSVTLTAISSLVACVSLPLILSVVANTEDLSGTINISLISTIKQLAFLTIVPVSLGMLLRKLSPKTATLIEPHLVSLAGLAFTVVLIALWSQQWQALLSSAQQVGLACLLLLLITILFAKYLIKLFGISRNQGVCLQLEIGVQNSVMAFFVATNILNNIDYAIPASIYSVFMIVAALLIIFSSREHTRS